MAACSLDVGEGVGVLAPDDGIAAVGGECHADEGARGGVGGGHLELQGARKDVPEGGRHHHARHAVPVAAVMREGGSGALLVQQSPGELL